jgi:dihydrofolate reductase
MRKIFFQMMVSLDGYFEPPDKSYDWHVTDDDFDEYVVRMLDSIDGMLMGRVVYEGMAEYWPTGEGPHARGMNHLEKIVFSRTRKELPVAWNNSRLVTGDAAEEIKRLKSQPGKDLSIGGSNLVASLVDTGLIDEYRILVAPVLLGGGTPLLHGITRRVKLKLTSTEMFHSGLCVQTYVPAP